MIRCRRRKAGRARRLPRIPTTKTERTWSLYERHFQYHRYTSGYVLWFIYRFVGNYFVSIFLFTLIVRAATFPPVP